MKDKFPEYFSIDEQEIKLRWDDSIFIFDTNILLSLYRYSKDSARQIFEAISGLGERIWLPYHVGNEFFNNRIEIINQQNDSYDSLIQFVEKYERELTDKIASKRHPHLSSSDKILTAVQNLNKSIKVDVEKEKSRCISLRDDWILNNLNKIFSGKIGDKFNESELDNIKKEGMDRFKLKIPPGYKDVDKNDNAYGDLIIWKEILRKVEQDETAVFFITDDDKEDWWLINKGEILSPRPELLSEIRKCKGYKFFHMYRLESFLKYSAEYNNRKIAENTFEEIRKQREEREKYIKEKERNKYLLKKEFERDDYERRKLDKIKRYKNEIEAIQHFENMGKDEVIYQREMSDDLLRKRENYKKLRGTFSEEVLPSLYYEELSSAERARLINYLKLRSIGDIGNDDTI